MVKAPSTLGTFLRSFGGGEHCVSRQLLANSPLTIDLDSTICETYGLAKEGARHHGYTGARGYHPLLAIAAGTGEVLMSRLRGGRANTARGAAHFLRETVGRVRYGGARGQLTVRADSGFYAHTVNGCPLLYHHPQRVTCRGDTFPFPTGWTAADVRRLHPVPDQAGRAAHCPAGEAAPGSQLALFGSSSPTVGRRWNWRPIIAATGRERHRDLKYGVGLKHAVGALHGWRSR